MATLVRLETSFTFSNRVGMGRRRSSLTRSPSSRGDASSHPLQSWILFKVDETGVEKMESLFWKKGEENTLCANHWKSAMYISSPLQGALVVVVKKTMESLLCQKVKRTSKGTVRAGGGTGALRSERTAHAASKAAPFSFSDPETRAALSGPGGAAATQIWRPSGSARAWRLWPSARRASSSGGPRCASSRTRSASARSRRRPCACVLSVENPKVVQWVEF